MAEGGNFQQPDTTPQGEPSSAPLQAPATPLAAPEPAAETAQPAERPATTIRTMQSDIQDLFHKGKESLVGAVAKEASGEPYEGEAAPSHRKLWFAIGGGTLIILLGFAAWGYFLARPATEEKPPVQQTVIPRPYFSMEKSRNIILKAQSFLDFRDNLTIIQNDKERDATFKRIALIVKDGETERLASVNDFFLAAGLTPTRDVRENIGNDFNFFLYYQKGAVRKGTVLPILNETRVFRAMLDSETLFRDSWNGLYDPSDPRGTLIAFEDITYRNIDIRRYQLPGADDLGFYYAIFKPKKYLVITTSYESMKAALDRIFDSF